MLKIKKDDLGSDGVVRVCYSTYYSEDARQFREDLARVTGVEWFDLGAYMDVGCMGTRDKSVVGKTYDIEMPE